MARTLEVRNPDPRQAVLWRTAQSIGVVATLGLLGGLFVLPQETLHVLWDVTVPILPAVFLLSPFIWRNVCPLATLNKLTGDRWGGRELPPRWMASTTAAGVILLYVLVPARRFLFNHNGPALAVTIAAVAILAVLLGFVFEGKAGFCNAICPVLNVERLYGQRPFADVANARCAPCTLCSARGCLDLSPEKSVAQTVGPKRRTRSWILTPFGVFAATFPGFIYAYFNLVDGPLSSAPAVYMYVVVCCAVSYLVVLVANLAFPNRNERFVLLLGGVSIGLYYWFAAPGLTESLALPTAVAGGLRFMALTVVLLWLRRGFRTA